ncbi:MAG: RNA methyltransferase [Chloroflexi bacterium]|nr:RNA methyltransferase [Chloroflexota bacterium]
MNELITSRSNPKIRFVKNIKAQKSSRDSGFFVVEGIHHVGEAFEAMQAGKGIIIHSLYYAPELLNSEFAFRIIQYAKAKNINHYQLSAYAFSSLAEKDNPQGILAVVQRKVNYLSELSPQNFNWGVALVSPQDAGNIGTIVRTIDAVNADGLILLDGGADPFHNQSVRASMGTLFWHVIVESTCGEFRQWIQQNHYHVVGTSAHAQQNYREGIPYQKPAILLMGSEQKGLTKEQASICEKMIFLPMKGRASSLNLAVATGVMLYAMLER